MREVRYELRVLGSGFRAQAMVKVRDVKTETELRRELAQKEQERDGVGAAGDRDDDGSGREEVVLTHEREDGRADRSGGRQRWLGRDLNPGPEAYESSALPLSYPAGTQMVPAQAASSSWRDARNSSSVRPPFLRLHGPHAGKMLSIELLPPRESGVR